MKNNQSAYKLIWSEDFENSNRLNPEIWTFEEGEVRNNEKQHYTVNRKENCRIENGMLILEARKEPWKGYDYTSASITTKFSKSFLYGRIEVRAKLPTGRGIWPAIWTLGTNIDEVDWPLCGEIDIMENVGFDPTKVHGNIHTKAFNHNLETNKGDYIESQSVAKEFHLYAINWTPSKIDFYFDDMRYFTFENDLKSDPETWPFDKPQYLLINLAVGGFWGGKKGIDDSMFPQQFCIDYIRYYEIDHSKLSTQN